MERTRSDGWQESEKQVWENKSYSAKDNCTLRIGFARCCMRYYLRLKHQRRASVLWPGTSRREVASRRALLERSAPPPHTSKFATLSAFS
jgi:hypothetical protein